MKLVLLSGGSGKRLWPLSNDVRSKQFLKILSNKDNELESMVQRVWNQLGAINMQESTVIATSKSQVDLIYSQLGNNVNIITEPERRDTFPAIALAATYLFSEMSIDEDEVIAVLPVDPYVDDDYFNRVLDLEKAIIESDADLALMGVSPTYPSSKYGYIVPNKENESIITVNHFKEKPTEDEATKLIEKGALWNCGVFAFRLGRIINMIENNGLPIVYKELLKNYNFLPKNSFDYEVVEKTEKIVAIDYAGGWKDLGTWNTLTEEMGSEVIGKALTSETTKNTHVINELDIPVTVMGINNAIIAVSPDGILVADKQESHKIKELVSGFNFRPMFEERRWGWYRVLDYTKYEDGKEVLTKRIGVQAGKNLSYQMHKYRSETWTIIKGEGVFALNGQLRVVRAGDVLEIPVGSKHALKAVNDLEIIEVQRGSQLIEEDIERIFMTWEEIETNCYQTR
jgi:mannose-1-phosphate guanylyltransferase